MPDMDSPEKSFLATPGSIRASKKEVCTGCQQPIIDRYIMRVNDNSWHETCLQCSVCRAHLAHTCYYRGRKLYCKPDYDKLFVVKCTGCSQALAPTELVMRALDHVYHLSCFVCVACGRQLQKGDQFVIRAGRLYCRPDFEKEMAVLQIVTRGENGQLTQPRQDGRRGPKRPRTILTTAQRRAFKASFEISQKPCRKVRETLAKETGLSVRIVQVWFQNQRAKLKKIQRKQQQLQQQKGGGDNGAPVDSPGKDSKKDDFSQGDSDYWGFYSGGEYTLKSDLESESSLGGLDDVLVDAPSMAGGNEGGTGPHLFPMNPIDKLYSMQNSYFNQASECECLGGAN